MVTNYFTCVTSKIVLRPQDADIQLYISTVGSELFTAECNLLPWLKNVLMETSGRMLTS